MIFVFINIQSCIIRASGQDTLTKIPDVIDINTKDRVLSVTPS